MIYISNGVIFSAINSKFYNLDSVGYGIIESVGNSEIYLSECNFSNIETVNNTIVGNIGAGAIYIEDGNEFSIDNCRFESISTFGNGGAIYIDNSGNGSIYNS